VKGIPSTKPVDSLTAPSLAAVSTGPGSVTRLFLSLSLFLFVVQILTGVLLMTAYSPAVQTAWGSVWYIQTQMASGWFVRGLHHFTSDAMIVALVCYVVLLLLTQEYAPTPMLRWWLGWLSIGLTLGAALSGHLLPWDQAGYWGTTVRLNILARFPFIGDWLKSGLVGGPHLGQLTLTRFYTLHVALIPLFITLTLYVLLRLAVRSNSTMEEPRAKDRPAITKERWFDQTHGEQLAGAMAFFALAVVVWLVCRWRGDALLDAPADPGTADFPARPEWHTLFLFQWLKAFSGPTAETIGTVLIPGVVVLLLLFLPLFQYVCPRTIARRVVMGCFAGLLLGVLGLTGAAIRADADPPSGTIKIVRDKLVSGHSLTSQEQAVWRAYDFNRRLDNARQRAARAFALAAEHGIPPEGPLTLLRNDPLSRGPQLFAAHCAACHRYDGHNGVGTVPPEPAASSDLFSYATRAWIRGLLSDPMADRYFGRMKKPDGDPAHTRMARFVSEQTEEHFEGKPKEELISAFDAVAAYLEDESIHPRRLAYLGLDAFNVEGARQNAPSADDRSAIIDRGRAFFLSVCNECHAYDGERTGTLHAPDMAGYGSVEWIEGMMHDPAGESRYRSQGREPALMPSFKDRLDAKDRRLIAEWLHQTRTVSP